MVFPLPTHRLFGTLFLIASLLLFAFYGQYFFVAINQGDLAVKFIDAVDKVFGINTQVNNFLPYAVVGEAKVSFLLAFYGLAFVFSFFSLFTKKRASLGATMYKLSAIFAVAYLIFYMLILSFLQDLTMSEMVFKIITYSCAGLSLIFFIVGFIASFNFKNPYRATWYQGFKALYFMVMIMLNALPILMVDVPAIANVIKLELITDILTYTMFNAPIYVFVASILLFIGSKYRGNIEKLV